MSVIYTMIIFSLVLIMRRQRWDGKKFARVSLKDLGLRVQLGHPVGESCVSPVTAFNDAFVVLDVTGVHEVGVDFCGCERAMAHWVQLLRRRWFPATSIDPQTAATLSLLEHVRLISVQSKVSAFEYYHALLRRTDHTSISPSRVPPLLRTIRLELNLTCSALQDWYQSFILMVNQWRHLKMLKRAGRGNDPVGVSATQPGECAVECPACPHPGKNVTAPHAENNRMEESQ